MRMCVCVTSTWCRTACIECARSSWCARIWVNAKQEVASHLTRTSRTEESSTTPNDDSAKQGRRARKKCQSDTQSATQSPTPKSLPDSTSARALWTRPDWPARAEVKQLLASRGLSSPHIPLADAWESAIHEKQSFREVGSEALCHA